MKLVDVYRVTHLGLLVCTLSVYGQQGSNNVEQRVDDILKQMTLAEKLSYIGGTGFSISSLSPFRGFRFL
jgi:hypothetical protein